MDKGTSTPRDCWGSVPTRGRKPSLGWIDRGVRNSSKGLPRYKTRGKFGSQCYMEDSNRMISLLKERLNVMTS